MSEQLVQQRIETDETEQQIFNDNKGERVTIIRIERS